jgi:monovalent cation/hydrogen antiporter
MAPPRYDEAMTETIQILLFLLAVLVAAALIARRLNTAPSIVLVVAGVLLALTPGLPPIELAPEFVLLLILPPLIYSAGVSMSWREFRFNLRPITLLAFGCVLFTTGAVAAAAYYLLGVPWAVGFLLGAIVAPPDVVAPLAITRRLGLPRRLLVVLEGEGLANDATALILYRFAVGAITTGIFSPLQATGTFAAIVVGEIAFGIGVGWLSLNIRRWARDPRAEIVLSLMTPYVAYWVPEHFGGSGVLATVATGLYVSWNGPLLIPSATRLQGIFFWDLIVYLIEGFVFLLTGLQARSIFERMQGLALRDVVVATVVTTVVIIVARFVWMYPATYLPRWLSASLRKRDPSPPWQFPFVLAFTGVRGVVSLAAALAIPLMTASGQPFPHRDLILLTTFGVIVITLVGIGLTLPLVIRWIGITTFQHEEYEREREAELSARYQAMDASLLRLGEIVRERELSEDVEALFKTRDSNRRALLPDTFADGDQVAQAEMNAELHAELIAIERKFLHQLLRDGKITDESRRRIERELDLEEATILKNNKQQPL